MNLATHISHYFERKVGPFLNICDLEPEERTRIIEREKSAKTGFNRFSYGEEFFDFRLLADDLLMELYARKFAKSPIQRPFYAVLGDADVVGGLYRDPFKIQISVEGLKPEELTFMCPDHFHLVSLMKGDTGAPMFGWQIPEDYSEARHPYFGKLLTYGELIEGFEALKIGEHVRRQQNENGWYRYVEAQIWMDPEVLRAKYGISQEVTPEPWTHDGVTHLQNYKVQNQTTDFAKSQ